MNIPMVFNLILVIVYVTASVNGAESRKLDETTVSTTNGTEVKCTPCGDNSPPSASPPPSPPPPSPKKPPSVYCPPPPSYIYITGPPGNLYPIDQDFSGASGCRHHHRSFAAFLVPLLFGVFAF